MVEDGLAQSQVYSIAEDDRGYLWFGTRGGGISRFDGFSFKNFTSADGLCNDYINVIRIAGNNDLWIGTDGGLCKFDGRKFEEVAQPGTFPGNQITDVLLDEGASGIWVATSRGLIRQASPNDDWHKAEPDGNDGAIFALLKDKDGRIWAGTKQGLVATVNPVQKGKAISWIRFEASSGLANNEVRSIMQDSRGRIWITHYGGGVSMFDPTKSKLDDPYPFVRMTVRDGLPNNIVVCSMEDRDGNIWFGTIEGGACRYDGRQFKYFTASQGLYTNNVRALHEDAWGNVWFGTSGGGVTRFGGDEFVHYREQAGLPGNRVYAMAQDTSGGLWLGTSGGGVSLFDGSSVETYGSDEGFMDQVCKAIMQDDTGTVWIGTEGMGFWRMDTSGFVQLGTDVGIQGNWVRAIIRDRRGRVWIGTADAGVTVWDGEQAINYTTGLISSLRINSLYEDSRGWIWIGTEGNGVNVFDGKKFKFYSTEEGLCSDAIRDIREGANGNMWIASSEGLTRIAYDKNGQSTISCHGRDEGLTSTNLYLLLPDGEGNLWAGSEKGADKLFLSADGKILQTSHFGKVEGFSGIETCQRAALVDNAGMLWFGTMNGLTRFDPSVKRVGGVDPKIHLTSVRLFYEEIEMTSDIVFAHDKNHLGFEFIGINQRNPEKVRYKWKLEGFDKEWSPITDKREVTYSNIPPGDYTFRVMAANEDGEWNETAATFTFTVKPPFWEAWWFRIPVATVAILSIVLIFLGRDRQVKRKNEARNREIQLEKSMLELEQKALRLQMNPHFIFNALNSIKGIMAENDTASARKYLVKFAQLMRLILVNSRSPFISLANEIKTLEHYLDLERLSRNDKFRYEIKLGDGIDPDMISIPPMIVQPFVENSILHGIAPMEKEGLIQISFERNGNNITCTVEDNGIGRKKAGEKKISGEKLHESQAVNVTSERLKMLTETEGPDYEIRYVDMEIDGEATGTKVIIDIPVGS